MLDTLLRGVNMTDILHEGLNYVGLLNIHIQLIYALYQIVKAQIS